MEQYHSRALIILLTGIKTAPTLLEIILTLATPLIVENHIQLACFYANLTSLSKLFMSSSINYY
jgi:hypothetical protein